MLGHAVGVYEELNLPFSLQIMLYSGFAISETVTSAMVTRYWRAQAKALENGFQQHLKDPQKRGGWLVQGLPALAFAVDVGLSFLMNRFVTSDLGSGFKFKHALGAYSAVAFVATAICGGALLDASLRVLRAPILDATSRRISMYALASTGFTALSLAGWCIIPFLYKDPSFFLVCMAFPVVGRAGTGFCQLCVFLPAGQCRHARVQPVVGSGSEVVHSETQLLVLETSRLKECLASERERADAEKDRLLLELHLKNTELEATHNLLQNKNAAEKDGLLRELHLKNTELEATHNLLQKEKADLKTALKKVAHLCCCTGE